MKPHQNKQDELETLVRVIANMAFGFNGSDKSNPPMIGISNAVETLKESMDFALSKTRQEERERIINLVENSFNGEELVYKDWNTLKNSLKKE